MPPTQYKTTLLRLVFGLCVVSTAALAERVDVKYRGAVDLTHFACQNTESSFVHRICYDAPHQYLIVQLQGTYYHYCRVPADTLQSWLSASSKGKFYSAYIKGRFDCRLGGVPEN